MTYDVVLFPKFHQMAGNINIHDKLHRCYFQNAHRWQKNKFFTMTRTGFYFKNVHKMAAENNYL